jgi:hypothetical protein
MWMPGCDGCDEDIKRNVGSYSEEDGRTEQ